MQHFDEQFLVQADHMTIAKTEKKTVNVVSTFDVYLGTGVDLEDCYAELLHLLRREVKEKDEVVIHLGNFGGSCHLGVQIINAVKHCKGKVHMQVEFPCYSMGAIMAVSGNSLTLEDDTFLMFHNYSGGSYGKGQEKMDAMVHTDAWLKKAFKRRCTPFLTKPELTKLFQDQDVYVHADGKGLKARMKRHFK